MPKLIDLTGQKFNLLTVISRAPNVGKRVHWKCRCDCSPNKEIAIRSDHLVTGHTQSCGCFGLEKLDEGRYKHGASTRQARHTLYATWSNIIQRCHNPNNKRYEDYGGRGIKVYNKWRNNYENFRDYVLELKNCPLNAETTDKNLKRTLDRIDNDKGYKPGNVRWATRKQQYGNRRNTIYVDYFGKRKRLSDLVEKYSELTYTVVRSRLKMGWPIQKALIEPIKRRKTK